MDFGSGLNAPIQNTSLTSIFPSPFNPNNRASPVVSEIVNTETPATPYETQLALSSNKKSFTTPSHSSIMDETFDTLAVSPMATAVGITAALLEHITSKHSIHLYGYGANNDKIENKHKLSAKGVIPLELKSNNNYEKSPTTSKDENSTNNKRNNSVINESLSAYNPIDVVQVFNQAVNQYGPDLLLSQIQQIDRTNSTESNTLKTPSKPLNNSNSTRSLANILDTFIQKVESFGKVSPHHQHYHILTILINGDPEGIDEARERLIRLTGSACSIILIPFAYENNAVKLSLWTRKLKTLSQPITDSNNNTDSTTNSARKNKNSIVPEAPSNTSAVTVPLRENVSVMPILVPDSVNSIYGTSTSSRRNSKTSPIPAVSSTNVRDQIRKLISAARISAKDTLLSVQDQFLEFMLGENIMPDTVESTSDTKP